VGKQDFEIQQYLDKVVPQVDYTQGYPDIIDTQAVDKLVE
jgi:hypothetical protein